MSVSYVAVFRSCWDVQIWSTIIDVMVEVVPPAVIILEGRHLVPYSIGVIEIAPIVRTNRICRGSNPIPSLVAGVVVEAEVRTRWSDGNAHQSSRKHHRSCETEQ